MKHEIIFIENLKCGGCQTTIRRDLLKQLNVLAVHIDDSDGSVHVSGEDDMERVHLVSRLERLGYPQRGKNSLSNKAKSYVSCVVGKVLNSGE